MSLQNASNPEISDEVESLSLSLEPNLKYYIEFNAVINLYVSILQIMNEITSLQKEIAKFESGIKDDKERFKKYCKSQNEWEKKKLKSIDKRNNLNNEIIRNINEKLLEFNKQYNDNVLNLFNIKPSLFQKNGDCLLNSNIKIDLNIENKKI